MSSSHFDAEAALEKLAKLDERSRLKMELIARGYTPRDIATMTQKSPVAVKEAIRRIYAKLGIHNIVELRCVVALSKSRDQRLPIA